MWSPIKKVVNSITKPYKKFSELAMVHFLEPKANYCYTSSMGEGKTESGLKNICLHPANLFFYFLNNRFDLECITNAEHRVGNVGF